MMTAKVPGAQEWRVGFGQRIRQLRQQVPEMSQLELARSVGLGTQDTITRLERGVATAVNLGVLAGLCHVAVERGRSADWLLLGADPLTTASREELVRAVAERLVKQVMGNEGMGPLLRLVVPREPGAGPPVEAHAPAVRSAPAKVVHGAGAPPREIGVEQLPDDWPGRYVPLLGRLSAGFGSDTAEAESRPAGWADSYIEYEGAPPHAVALRVSGESMLPIYHHGDIVVVDPDEPVESGGIGAVIYDDPRVGDRLARLKRIRPAARKVILESLNPTYPPIALRSRAIHRTCRIIRHLS